MRKILLSILVMGIALMLLGAGTLSYFYDIETSTDNYFQAGKLDLKIDWDSYWYRDWPDPYLMGEKHQTMDDLTGENFFDWNDIKPGDHGEATISIHVFDNDAWGWLHFFDVADDDNGLTEPEETLGMDTTGGAGEGELSEHIYTFLWLDEGMISGWQNSDNDPTNDDPYEGNNIYDCWTDPNPGHQVCEPVLFGTPYAEEATMSDMYKYDCCWIGPWFIENCKTIYIGWYWWIPTWVENIIQSDSFEFSVEFQVDQYRNNPMPTPPGDFCNQPPIADPNGPYYGYIGDLITFDGSASCDPDEGPPLFDSIVSWEWDMDGDGSYDDATGEVIQWMWDDFHFGIVGLRVTDSFGATGTNDAEILVGCIPADLWAVEYRYGDPDPGYSWDGPNLTSWLEVRIENYGPGDAFNVIAEIMDWPANVEIIDGTVTIGNIPVGGSAWSTDTYTIKVDTSDPQDPNEGIYWRIEYDDICGVHHVIEMVPEFPPP